MARTSLILLIAGAVVLALATGGGARQTEAQGGGGEGGGVLSLQDGGQFVFWTFGPAGAADVFATVKIAWLFETVSVSWTSFIPALGQTNFALVDGAVLWIVSQGAQEITIGEPTELPPKEPIPEAQFLLTSSAFADGEPIPARHACDGADLSPELSWSGAPEGTQSFALVMRDLTNDTIHWVIWDIPASSESLPEAVEKLFEPAVPAGARQSLSFDGNTRGYLGPCPPEPHTYEFLLCAMDVETLQGVDESSTSAELDPLIRAQALGEAPLTGTFAP